MKHPNLPRSPFISMRRAKLKTCVICGGPDNCSIREDRSQMFCRRAAGASWPGSVAGAGGYTCKLDASVPRAPTITTRKPTLTPVAVANENIRHAVYSAFLRSLNLSTAHNANLMARGLSSEVIKQCLFRSAPSPLEAAEVTRHLAQDCDLTGVAGFYKERGAWRAAWMDESILIPVLDQHARIVALMRRRTRMRPGEKGKYLWFATVEDRNGNPRDGAVSSGSPCHFANAHMLRDALSVTLTEGALKAQIAAFLLNQPVIGNSPSGYAENFGSNLKANFPKLKTVYCAFDSDFTKNEHVRSALFRLTSRLEQAGFDARVRTWPPELGKGIDDYLLNISTGRAAA
jgi:hypothetical protein